MTLFFKTNVSFLVHPSLLSEIHIHLVHHLWLTLVTIIWLRKKLSSEEAGQYYVVSAQVGLIYLENYCQEVLAGSGPMVIAQQTPAF